MTEAIALLEATLKLFEAKLGPDHPDMFTSRGILAAAYSAVAAFVTEEHREKARAWIEHEQLS